MDNPFRHALEVLIGMIEETQSAINADDISAAERRLLIAKRDALTEARMRIRDGSEDPYWVFRDLGGLLRR